MNKFSIIKPVAMKILKDLVVAEFQLFTQNSPKMTQEEKQHRADDIIRNHLAFAASAALLPIPLADFAAVSAVQLNMLRQLATVYRVGFADSLGRNVIAALAGGGIARVGASLIKAIPGVGTLIGEFTMPALSAASTYALGQVVANHFSKGGTLEDFDMRTAKKKYEEELKNGKQAAKETAAKVENPEDLVTKLKKLSELKDAGILSEDEFSQMKAKILAQL
jgi:uncharacterized protein (DUF697 family)